MSANFSTDKRCRGFGFGVSVALFLAPAIDAAIAAVDRAEPSASHGSAPLAKAVYTQEAGVERIALDLGGPIGHVAKRDGDQLIIWFDQPRRFDLDALSDRPGSRLVGIRTPEEGRTSEEGASRWLVLDLAPDSGVQSERLEDDQLIITIEPAGDKSAALGSNAGSTGGKASSARQASPGETDRDGQAEAIEAEQGPGQVAVAVDDVRAERNTGRDEQALTPDQPKSHAARPGKPRDLTPALKQTADEPAVSDAAPAISHEPGAGQSAPSNQPVSLPGQFEVDETALDRALERTLAREGAVLLPFGSVEIEPSLSYTRQEFGAPTLINVFGFPGFGETKIRRNDATAALAARFGLPFDAQLELDVPFSYVDQSVMTMIGFDPIDEDESDTFAFGDLGVGLAKTVLREGSWRPDVVARVRWDSQTGKTADDGIALGGGSHELTGSLSIVKSQDPLAFFGTVAYEATFEEDDLDPGDRIGVSIGTVLAASPETSLRASLRQDFIGDAELDGDQLDGTDQLAATLNVGASSVLGRGVLLDAAAEVGLTDDAPDYAARVSLPIRFDLRRAFSLRARPAADEG